MKEEEIVEGNTLIAEFMGLEKREEPPTLHERYIWADGYFHPVTNLKYHSSWDWLMPVVEKIEKDFAMQLEVIIYSSSCFINKWNRKHQNYVSYIMGTGKKIEAVYQAVVEFLKQESNR